MFKLYDAIVIGAGVGGLSCAANLAANNKKVLVLERIFFIGGTSYIFKRGPFFFPMGPLSISYPNFVKKMLLEMGINEKIDFERHHFQLISPHLDIVYSQEWNEFEKQLKRLFPQDHDGMDAFFNELNKVIAAIDNVQEWHPEFFIGSKRELAEKKVDTEHEKEYEIIEKYSKISCKDVLDKYIKDDYLKRLLGSQGSYQPKMSMVHLAFLWKVMSIEGIWYPSCGMYGISP